MGVGLSHWRMCTKRWPNRISQEKMPKFKSTTIGVDAEVSVVGWNCAYCVVSSDKPVGDSTHMMFSPFRRSSVIELSVHGALLHTAGTRLELECKRSTRSGSLFFLILITVYLTSKNAFIPIHKLFVYFESRSSTILLKLAESEMYAIHPLIVHSYVPKKNSICFFFKEYDMSGF